MKRKALLRRFASVMLPGDIKNGHPTHPEPSGNAVWLYIGSDAAGGEPAHLHLADFMAAREALGMPKRLHFVNGEPQIP